MEDEVIYHILSRLEHYEEDNAQTEMSDEILRVVSKETIFTRIILN